MSDLYPSDLAQPLVTDVLVSDSEQDVAEQELVVPQTPVKKGNKKAALNNGATPTKKTPAPKKASIKKSSAKAKNQGENDEDGATPLAPTSSAKKRSADANNDTPSKKRATGGGARANGIPSSKSKLSEEDKLIIDMKDNGRGWKEIEAEWAKITGKAPGIDYCRKRYPKLKAATVEWADGDVERMLWVKKTVDQKVHDELAAAVSALTKKSEVDKWVTIAAEMKALGSADYTGPAVETGFAKEKKAGFPHEPTIDTVIAAIQNGAADLEEDDEPVEEDENGYEVDEFNDKMLVGED